MPTEIKENYLKALFHLGQKCEKISVSDLGKELGVSKPTASDMAKKLDAKGWVHYQKYKPLRLSDEGKKQAASIIRKHRLSEMFLSQIMGFGWEAVHEMAEELEHIKSETFFDRMDELLGFPTTDPHGSPIPDKQGCFKDSNYSLLSATSKGEEVTIKALINSSSEFIVFLNNKKIKLGTVLKVLSKEPFDQSILVSYNGKKITLSQSVCNRLLVE